MECQPMAARKMHADEVDTDASLVGRLLAAQFPQWADLPVEPVESAGTDHAIYRLGEDMSVRLPRIRWATAQADKEGQWLPRLAPLLPLAVPTQLAKGTPAEDYPWEWSIYRWLDGENATLAVLPDLRPLATELAGFVLALQKIDPADGPSTYRGRPLAIHDAPVRNALIALDGVIDTDAATAAWESALEAPAWDGPPIWVHGDLMSGNLLTTDGRLTAVIDFGCLGVGDPACDVIAAWNLFTAESRDVFRTELGVDDGTWARGRGWALGIALVALPYYLETSPVIVRSSLRTISEVLADQAPTA
jgi:aminoglycoside phosphotransferase (APT) family kinase protein